MAPAAAPKEAPGSAEAGGTKGAPAAAEEKQSTKRAKRAARAPRSRQPSLAVRTLGRHIEYESFTKALAQHRPGQWQIYGPPGCGKTWFVYAALHAAKYATIHTAEVVAASYAKGRHITSMYTTAFAKRPMVFFLDCPRGILSDATIRDIRENTDITVVWVDNARLFRRGSPGIATIELRRVTTDAMRQAFPHVAEKHRLSSRGDLRQMFRLCEGHDTTDVPEVGYNTAATAVLEGSAKRPKLLSRCLDWDKAFGRAVVDRVMANACPEGAVYTEEERDEINEEYRKWSDDSGGSPWIPHRDGRRHREDLSGIDQALQLAEAASGPYPVASLWACRSGFTGGRLDDPLRAAHRDIPQIARESLRRQAVGWDPRRNASMRTTSEGSDPRRNAGMRTTSEVLDYLGYANILPGARVAVIKSIRDSASEFNEEAKAVGRFLNEFK